MKNFLILCLVILTLCPSAYAIKPFRIAQITYPALVGFDLYETHRTCIMPLFKEPGQIRCEGNFLYPTELKPQLIDSAIEITLLELLAWKLHKSKHAAIQGLGSGILLGMSGSHLVDGLGQRGWRLKYQFTR